MRPITTRLCPLLVAAALGLGAAGAHAQDAGGETAADPAEVLATVNGVEITRADHDRALEELGQALTSVPEAQRSDYVMSYLTDLEVISQHAAEQGLSEEESYRDQMEFLGKQALTEIFLDRAAEEGATEEAARTLYDEVIGSAEPEVEVRARHILVETEEEAAEIVGQLEDGASFEDLAKEASQDPGSAAKGGDLGYFTRDRMVPEFAEAAFTLEPGTVSDPVQSQFGWHVIKVEDKREAEKPAFEDVAAELKSLAGRNAQRDTVAELREAAEIEVVEAEPETPSEAVPDAEAPAEADPAPETPEAPAEQAE